MITWLPTGDIHASPEHRIELASSTYTTSTTAERSRRPRHHLLAVLRQQNRLGV